MSELRKVLNNIACEAEAAPQQRRFTREDYNAMLDRGMRDIIVLFAKGEGAP